MSASPPNLETLAIDGGSPVREKLLPYGRQSLGEDDIQAVVDVLRSDWLTTGPKVGEFEEAFAEWVGARHAVSFSSGTAALHGAAFTAGLGRGDEAITTPLTFCATANCVLYQGANPIFADVCEDTLNLDPRTVLKKISPHTKAIIAVDYAGHPVDLDELRRIADEAGSVLIEDACHAMGAEYRGKRVGNLADMSIFSFHPVKHLTTGEGGMVTTDNLRLAETLRRFRNHGISSEARDRHEAGQWFYEMVLLGFNYRLTDIACALGLSQLGKLEANLARRRATAVQYERGLGELARSKESGYAAITLPATREEVNPAWHLYPIRVNVEALSVGRAEIFRALRAENIGVNVHYIPVYRHPYYRERFPDKNYAKDCLVAENSYERLISLPMFHAMTDEDVADVIRAVHKVIEHYATGEERVPVIAAGGFEHRHV
ncbi:MAG TPA: UDP-4-amino-4,6-dideoxy-N-acetyl-beta-L-altrosamine transaminase [Terriglobales bacterium]|nr:UDP-4-amino-4,6-dideoxy-N-acetyl-beta-L-altrosamine transaminase [Terriglobales bacterium]